MVYQTFSIVFSRLVEKSPHTDAEIARRLDVNRSTISRWKSGDQSPPLSKIPEIAALFDVHPTIFVGESADSQIVAESSAHYGARKIKGASWKVPLYGSIAAGQPLEMINVEDYIEIPEYIADRYPDAFLLRVNGDSMNKIVPSGMYALIDPCKEIKNGEVAAVAINGYDATLKRFFRLQNSIALEPESYNDAHTPRIYSGEEAANLKVIGKLVWFMPPFDARY